MKNRVIQKVLTPEEGKLVDKLQVALESRLNIKVPMSQVVGLSLQALARKEKVQA